MRTATGSRMALVTGFALSPAIPMTAVMATVTRRAEDPSMAWRPRGPATTTTLRPRPRQIWAGGSPRTRPALSAPARQAMATQPALRAMVRRAQPALRRTASVRLAAPPALARLASIARAGPQISAVAPVARPRPARAGPASTAPLMLLTPCACGLRAAAAKQRVSVAGLAVPGALARAAEAAVARAGQRLVPVVTSAAVQGPMAHARALAQARQDRAVAGLARVAGRPAGLVSFRRASLTPPSRS